MGKTYGSEFGMVKGLIHPCYRESMRRNAGSKKKTTPQWSGLKMIGVFN
jgi:hypothetical protein